LHCLVETSIIATIAERSGVAGFVQLGKLWVFALRKVPVVKFRRKKHKKRARNFDTVLCRSGGAEQNLAYSECKKPPKTWSILLQKAPTALHTWVGSGSVWTRRIQRSNFLPAAGTVSPASSRTLIQTLKILIQSLLAFAEA
jgi:hypothetical protein